MSKFLLPPKSYLRPAERRNGPGLAKTGQSGSPDRFSVPHRCAITAKIFTVVFERVSPNHKYQMTDIKLESERGGFMERLRAAVSIPLDRRTFLTADMDFSGLYCPYCGFRDDPVTVLCCKCKALVCGGRIRSLADGTQLFACHDGCGDTGPLGDWLESLDGSSEAAPKNSAKLGHLNRRTTTALPNAGSSGRAAIGHRPDVPLLGRPQQ